MSFESNLVRNNLRLERSLIGGQKSKGSRKPISKDLREKTWLKYMKNKTLGVCYCCGIKPIHFTDFEVGHNKSVFAGGTNHIDNLRPICRSCNRGMKTKSIEWYKKKFYDTPAVKPKKKIVKAKSKPKQQGLFFGLPKFKPQKFKF